MYPPYIYTNVHLFFIVKLCLSPCSFQYLAHRSPKKSKEKIIELLFRWSIELKNEPKIFEAYQMLKKQGLVAKDPVDTLPVSMINFAMLFFNLI